MWIHQQQKMLSFAERCSCAYDTRILPLFCHKLFFLLSFFSAWFWIIKLDSNNKLNTSQFSKRFTKRKWNRRHFSKEGKLYQRQTSYNKHVHFLELKSETISFLIENNTPTSPSQMQAKFQAVSILTFTLLSPDWWYWNSILNWIFDYTSNIRRTIKIDDSSQGELK